jgi:hypothetical protein
MLEECEVQQIRLVIREELASGLKELAEAIGHANMSSRDELAERLVEALRRMEQSRRAARLGF